MLTGTGFLLLLTSLLFPSPPRLSDTDSSFINSIPLVLVCCAVACCCKGYVCATSLCNNSLSCLGRCNFSVWSTHEKEALFVASEAGSMHVVSQVSVDAMAWLAMRPLQCQERVLQLTSAGPHKLCHLIPLCLLFCNSTTVVCPPMHASPSRLFATHSLPPLRP